MYFPTQILLLLFSLQSRNFLYVEAKAILFFHVGGTASHRTSIWPLAEKLADVGHNVTYVFASSKRLGSHPQVLELKPSKMTALVDGVVANFDINHRLNNTIDEWLQDYFSNTVKFCEAFYDSPEIQLWLASPDLRVDLIMLDGGWGQCVYGLVHKFKAKHIIFNPVSRHFLWEPFGIVPESASIPELMYHQKPWEMATSLWSRTVNTIAPFVWRRGFLKSLHSMEVIVREKLKFEEADKMPSFEEIEQDTSLVLHNTYFIEDYPLSLPPMYVSYSGLLCSEKEKGNRKPLPKEIKSFIENDKESHGFVYISFGSAVIASAMPESLRNEFWNAFAAFPRLKFLWRWTGDVPEDTPENVLLLPWFPQQDLLAHPNISAFITQAGRPSTQEALCYGVPMIAIPIFADQDFNADRLKDIGAAISLEITTMTTAVLVDVIYQTVETDKYKERIAELSAMFRDRPMDPVDNALYWVEYVLKHNTSLLKPLAMKQTWWQRRLLDVYLLIFGMAVTVAILTLLLFYVLIKFVKRIAKHVNVGTKFKRKKE